MRTSKQGFTLIELLLALGIFSILALLAYGGLNSVLAARETVTVESSRLAAVQRCFVRLGRDFGQLSPRTIRDGFGDTQPALKTGDDTYSYTHKDEETGEKVSVKVAVLVEFSAAGKRILPGQKRSSIQRVAYAVHENTLLRLNWSVLDRAQDSQPYFSEVLTDIDQLNVRFLKTDGNWVDTWTTDDVALEELPFAVEVIFEDKKWGKLRRVFQVS